MFKKDRRELNVLKTKIINPCLMLCWASVTVTKYRIFSKRTKIHYYYSTFTELETPVTVNTDTLEDAPQSHARLIENHFYTKKFAAAMFGINSGFIAPVVKLELVKSLK